MCHASLKMCVVDVFVSLCVSLRKKAVSMITNRLTALDELCSSIRGRVITPGNEEYHQARAVWNAMIDVSPALIVQCTNEQDVQVALQFVQTHALPFSVRSGGHSPGGSGLCEGVVIDCRLMKEIVVDPVARRVRVGAGATLGELISATQQHGLAMTIGTVSGTGVAGLTLGGGLGWLMGKYGFTADLLEEVQMVLADGRICTVNASQEPDLFWAIRGGGGNFGIVTSFTFRLFPLDQVLAGLLLFPMEHAETLLHRYRDLTQAAPDELTVYGAFVNPPDVGPAVGVAVCYCGDNLTEGERLLAPLREVAPVLLDTIRPQSYLDVSYMLDAGAPDGWRYYEKGGNIALTDEAIRTMIEHAKARISPLTQIMIQHIHGQATRISPQASAVSQPRTNAHNLLIVSTWRDPAQDDAHRAYARTFWKYMEPWSSKGSYTNFLGNDSQDRVRAAFGSEKYARLVALKQRYDPQNIFCHNNFSIAPAQEI